MILFFHHNNLIIINTIYSLIQAILLIISFYIINEFNISWFSKILIAIPVLFIFLKLIFPLVATIAIIINIPIIFILYLLILIEKKIRGLKNDTIDLILKNG